MYITSTFVTVLAAASTVQAFQIRDLSPSAPKNKRVLKDVFSWAANLLTKNQAPKQECPAVWGEISTTLTAQFLADGQCTDAARAAIRGAFHDCFNGACDGSLILANECTNSENRGLERLCTQLGGLATEKKVGVADLIQFAAAHAIKTCPGGPTIPVKVGRKDSSNVNALGVLPSPNAKATDLIKSFASKGFTPTDLTALIGAHTAGRQRTVDPSRANATFDTTPGLWDNKFYVETQNGRAPFTIPADKDISKNLITMIPFKAFALSKGAWDAAFVPAMTKMSMIGMDSKGLIDCTSALPGGSRKRDVKSSNAFDRLKW